MPGLGVKHVPLGSWGSMPSLHVPTTVRGVATWMFSKRRPRRTNVGAAAAIVTCTGEGLGLSMKPRLIFRVSVRFAIAVNAKVLPHELVVRPWPVGISRSEHTGSSVPTRCRRGGGRSVWVHVTHAIPMSQSSRDSAPAVSVAWTSRMYVPLTTATSACKAELMTRARL